MDIDFGWHFKRPWFEPPFRVKYGKKSNFGGPTNPAKTNINILSCCSKSPLNHRLKTPMEIWIIDVNDGGSWWISLWLPWNHIPLLPQIDIFDIFGTSKITPKNLGVICPSIRYYPYTLNHHEMRCPDWKWAPRLHRPNRTVPLPEQHWQHRDDEDVVLKKESGDVNTSCFPQLFCRSISFLKLTNRTWKFMVGRRSFPFLGAWLAYFQGRSIGLWEVSGWGVVVDI